MRGGAEHNSIEVRTQLGEVQRVIVLRLEHSCIEVRTQLREVWNTVVLSLEGSCIILGDTPN